MRYKWLGSITSMLVAAGAPLAQALMPADSTAPRVNSVEHVTPAADAPPPTAIPNLPPPVPNETCGGACGDQGAAVEGLHTGGYVSGSSARAWFGAEYLLWWIKNGPTPALVGQIPTSDAL